MNTQSTGTLERDRLQRFLDERFGTGELAIEPISGGQSNPTFFVHHGERALVLRKKPAGEILKGAHAIEREYRVLKALEHTGVPVPRAVLLCEDSQVIGTPFYLMERLEGRVFSDCSLAALDKAERRPVYRAMAQAMAAMHAVDPAAVGLGDFGRPGNYFERQLARWSRQYEESPCERIPELDRVIGWLRENLPPDDGRIAIAHGDFRLGNLLFHPAEPKVIGILDWELSTLGHPLADLGFACMPWHSSPDEYGGIVGLDHAALGLPEEQEFVSAYYEAAIPTPPLEPFHIAFALFRFAVIFVGISDRARMGNAAGHDAADVAPLARRFAIRADQVASGAAHS